MSKKRNNRKIIIIILIASIIFFSLVYFLNKDKRIYLNKPVSWENAYIYIYDENTDTEVFGNWPGKQLINKEDYIYYCDIENKLDLSNNYKIRFNDGKSYKVENNYIDYNQIYNITNGIGEKGYKTEGNWEEYKQNISFGKIPQTKSKIKNVIFMIGDGMGKNHILATNIYKEEDLNIQKIENYCYVKTSSITSITDSAAAATALSTGYKTTNGTIGKDVNGNDVQNLMEFTISKKLKTGIVCTQIINHATPAGFSTHNIDRNNYDEIALSQIKSSINLMFGGGRTYFSKYQQEMVKNNYNWINKISELENIDKTKNIIGTFGENTISEETNRVSLSDMTKKAITILENDNGFFLMIEGSCIDTYSHSCNMSKVLKEMIDFDNAVKIAKEYVDNNEDTLLIVTADHETGGLVLDNITNKEQLSDLLFKSEGEHTQEDVLLYAYGQGAEDITKYDIIDNTSISKFIKQGLSNYYGGSNGK